jgi:hypothetical protein
VQESEFMANFVPIDEALSQSKYTSAHIRYLIRHNLVDGKKVSVIWFVDLESLIEYEKRMDEAGKSKFRPKTLDQIGEKI